MQSILQFRRIGRRVKQQLEQGRRKDDGLQGTYNGDSTTSAQSEGEIEAADAYADIEQGIAEKPPTHGSLDQPEEEDVEEQDQGSSQTPLDSSEEGETSKEGGDDGAGLGATLSKVTTRSRTTLGTRIGHALTGVNVRDRTTKEGGDRSRQVFVVGFQGARDPTNPQNWNWMKRMAATFMIASIGAVVGIASSIDSSILRPASRAFGVSEVTESLATGECLHHFPIRSFVGRNRAFLSCYVTFPFMKSHSEGCEAICKFAMSSAPLVRYQMFEELLNLALSLLRSGFINNTDSTFRTLPNRVRRRRPFCRPYK